MKQWLCLACLLVVATPLSAGTVWISGAATTLAVDLVNMRDARFHGVVRQAYDFSCGAASVATLLTYHYDDSIDERTALDGMLEHADAERVQTEGFSMLDMKHFLAERGLNADGFRAGLDALAGTGIPAIALITTNGYRHFVVIQGVSPDEVLVGDPALGVRVYSRAEFKRIWNGLLFLVRDNVEQASETFNRTEQWAVRTRIPYGIALQRPTLEGFTLSLPRAGDY